MSKRFILDTKGDMDVDSSNNGLSTVVERFKAERLSGHVTLFKGERSELAERAADVL